MYRFGGLLVILSIFLWSGCKDTVIDKVLLHAGENRGELERVLLHYEGDSLKQLAAMFLIEHMMYKSYYTGEQVKHYDRLLEAYDSLRIHEQVLAGDPPAIKRLWNDLLREHGTLSRYNLQRQWDCQTLKADFLIENIDCAFEAWESTPERWKCSFAQFLEYVLPYRVGQEVPESYRRVYYERYSGIRDTTDTDSLLMVRMNDQFFWKEHYRNSELMWSYPLDLSVSQMETGKRGTCHHLSNYCALVMRAMGLPVAIDHVMRWGNRSKGHAWNVLIHPDGSGYPFDAFARDSLKFAYKPAKILRRMFSVDADRTEQPSTEDVPIELLQPDERDVTHLYGKTYDVEVDCIYPYEGKGKKKHGVICVFDNKEWQPIWWGKIYKDKMRFENMMGDVCYMAAYYEKGRLYPASAPFILTKEGEMRKLDIDPNVKADMKLLRKYPRFERMDMHAMKLRRSRIEGANDAVFRDTVLLFDQFETPHDVNDSLVRRTDLKFRFVRWKIAKYRTGDLAEVEFYGKRTLDGLEEKLNGTVIGVPEPTGETAHPYQYAMDGDPATFFSKPKNQTGYVGLDLGEGNEAYITRVHFHPRSDTNYILIGDTYELCYWDKDRWASAGKQIATRHELTFKEVPQGTFYILKDLTKGKEERIFTYESGEQVWW